MYECRIVLDVLQSVLVRYNHLLVTRSWTLRVFLIEGKTAIELISTGDPLYGGSLKPTPEPKTFFFLPSIHAFRGVHHDSPPIKSSLPTSIRPCRSAEPGPLPHTFRPSLCPPRAFPPKQNKHTKASQRCRALLRDPSNTRSASWDASCSSPPVGEGSWGPFYQNENGLFEAGPSLFTEERLEGMKMIYTICE